MQPETVLTSDLNTLLALNRDYIRSVQAADVKRFEEILADDFLCSLPDGSLIDRKRFLEQTAQPVTISNLEVHDVNVRLMGDFAIIHARTAYTASDGRPGSGRYTDVWARRNSAIDATELPSVDLCEAIHLDLTSRWCGNGSRIVKKHVRGEARASTPLAKPGETRPSMTLKVWQFINILLSALVVGVFWGPWLGLSRSIDSFTPETFLAIGQRMISNLAPVMPILMPAAILSTVPVLFILYRRRSKTFYSTFVSAAGSRSRRAKRRPNGTPPVSADPWRRSSHDHCAR